MQIRKMPKPKEVYDYWIENLLNNFAKYSFEGIYEIDKYICFACNTDVPILHRCHILAKCNGGLDNVENIHMLCQHCHLESESLYGKLYWDWFIDRHMQLSFYNLHKVNIVNKILKADINQCKSYSEYVNKLSIN